MLGLGLARKASILMVRERIVWHFELGKHLVAEYTMLRKELVFHADDVDD